MYSDIFTAHQPTSKVRMVIPELHYITSKKLEKNTLADISSLVKDFVRATDTFYMYIHTRLPSN